VGATSDPLRCVGGRVDVPGVRVGTWTDAAARTGVTVLLLPDGTRGAVDVAGGGPATRETDALRPDNLVPGPHALVLTGGSAPGLAAADGVVRLLQERGVGVPVGGVRVPVVAAAAIFDLAVGAPRSPGPDEGAAAAAAAVEGDVPEGQAGAGTGATVGKLFPPPHPAGGQGAATLATPDGLKVAALAVVNAVGVVLGEDGRPLAGGRAPDGTPLDPLAPLAFDPRALGGGHTTLAAVVTDAALDKASLARVARMAQAGMARAIEPVHTLWDGDAVFALATGAGGGAEASRVGALAARALAIAIRRAVLPA
jgi:L-aminopeptidase/D-esterase-like protein